MSEKTTIELGNIQKTLMLPLWGRAFETQKEKPMLIDRTALEIIEKVDFDFTEITQNIDELSQIAWIIRSICVDEVVRGFLERHPQATIVNIGCGLDTTFDRVDNGAINWYDLDLPDVIQLRRQFISETDRRRFISASFLDKNWRDEIQSSDNILFIAAGVFYYFIEDEIKNFLIDLADRFPGNQIVFDVSSAYGVKVANKKVIQSSGLDERSYLTWGLDRVDDLLAWDPRLHILDILYYFKRKNLNISSRNRLFGYLSDYLKIQYMIHLEFKPG